MLTPRSDAVLRHMGFHLQKHNAGHSLLYLNITRNCMLDANRAVSQASSLNLCGFFLGPSATIINNWIGLLGFLKWRQLLKCELSHLIGSSSQLLQLLNRKCLLLLSLITASFLGWRCNITPICRLIALLLASADAEQYALVLFGWMHYSP